MRIIFFITLWLLANAASGAEVPTDCNGVGAPGGPTELKCMIDQQAKQLQQADATSNDLRQQVQSLQQQVSGYRSKSNVAVPIDLVSGGFPVNGTFSSNGGKILITANGSGFTADGARLIGMNIAIDGVMYGQAKSFTNENRSHKAFVMKSLLLGGIMPGNHTITLSSWNDTKSDVNDFYTVTVVEFPN